MNTQQDKQISSVENTGIENTSPPFAGVGKTLREAREQLGMSVSDVANRIKFATRQIEFLEAEDYAQLPEAAFVRGFVRSYARLLALDPVQLISYLPSSHGKSTHSHEMKSVDIPMPTAMSARRYNIIWLAAALVIAVSLAIFERLHERVPEVTQPVTTAMVQPLELPNVGADGASAPIQVEPLAVEKAPDTPLALAKPAVATPAVRAEPVVVAPVLTPIVKSVAHPPVVVTPPAPLQEPSKKPIVQKEVAPKEAAPKEAAPKEMSPKEKQPPPAPVKVARVPSSIPLWQPYLQKSVRKPAATTSANGTQAASATAAKTNAIKTSGDRAIRLEFELDAWVEVKDATDKILISKKYAAGSLVRVSGKAPLLVVIGNAKAVRLFDNGKKIKLDRYTTADVARVKLK